MNFLGWVLARLLQLDHVSRVMENKSCCIYWELGDPPSRKFCHAELLFIVLCKISGTRTGCDTLLPFVWLLIYTIYSFERITAAFLYFDIQMVIKSNNQRSIQSLQNLVRVPYFSQTNWSQNPINFSGDFFYPSCHLFSRTFSSC